ncbi:MAG TPA: type II CAAX endopeptidase family protein [Candidatus Sulfotelmatobacter sp.]
MSSPENPPLNPPPPLGTGSQTPVASDLAAPDLFLPAPLIPASIPPAENPVFNGWDVLQLAGVTLLTLIVLQFAIVLAARKYYFPRLSLLEAAQKPILALVSELLAYAVIALFMVMFVEGKYHVRFWQAIRWNWPRREWRVWKLLGIGMTMLFALNILERFLPMPKTVPFDQFFERPVDAYLTSIFAISFGPLMEELFFRGFLYPVLARRMGVIWGVLLTALPFGLMHAFQYGNAWSAVLVIFIVGIVLTVVRAVTKSVGASFLVHLGYNGTLMVLVAIATCGFRHMENASVLVVSVRALLKI